MILYNGNEIFTVKRIVLGSTLLHQSFTSSVHEGKDHITSKDNFTRTRDLFLFPCHHHFLHASLTDRLHKYLLKAKRKRH